ncbi:hypothetical protein [Ferrimicrobium acidiphilum]|uniref:hypothetical protein n=1 Tax=Ferrimicrobium acidiphilum TaxID=121039 RepID=UPI0023EF6801|nr:hypothetical protein [Ferrimicrobium acidiphilum]
MATRRLPAMLIASFVAVVLGGSVGFLNSSWTASQTGGVSVSAMALYIWPSPYFANLLPGPGVLRRAD